MTIQGLARSRRNLGLPLLCLLLATGLPASALGHESGEHVERVWFVPRLVGAFSIDGSILAPFGLGTTSGYPTTGGISIGWRQFFEARGQLSLRVFGVFERGGLLHPGFEGRSTRLGVGAALTARGISTDWVFGSITVIADASALEYEAPEQPSIGRVDSKLDGMQFGIGLESTFGALVVLDPYLFTETGASATISHIRLPTVDAWEVWARWIIRFEWAISRPEE